MSIYKKLEIHYEILKEYFECVTGKKYDFKNGTDQLKEEEDKESWGIYGQLRLIEDILERNI
jgi:hypothetical protein|tara:strand:+ start:270 stop:455 length:186 start_codon:yes stop_codon:yes gene_type:complete